VGSNETDQSSGDTKDNRQCYINYPFLSSLCLEIRCIVNACRCIFRFLLHQKTKAFNKAAKTHSSYAIQFFPASLLLRLGSFDDTNPSH